MNKVFIIAEAGVNHNGDLNIARKLIDVATEAGADAIKFQTFKADQLVCKDVKKAQYQLETTEKNETQYEMIKKLELSYEMHKELIEYSRTKGIKFLSTPFDIESIELLTELGIDIFKIPSGEITNLPYLQKIAELDKKIILSTGMSTMQEIEETLEVLNYKQKRNVVVLHCNTEYPTPLEDVNLKAMLTIKNQLGVEIGYSDHTDGIEVPIAAVAMGATVIEKHFTLDRNMEGPDHKASLEPMQLKQMILAIRNIERALGDGVKKPSKSELRNMDIARKSIVALNNIKKGEVFSENNITTKRPGNGLSPMRWNEVLGKKADRDYKKDELIKI